MAASGMHTNEYRMDVAANNLANIQTTGYKPDFVTLMQRQPERVEDGLALRNPNKLLEKLSGGILLAPTQTKFSQGVVTSTGNPLDVALEGDGFFAVDLGRGEPAERFRFTRDGRMTIDPDGFLTHIASRAKMLDQNDRPIRLHPNADVTIQEDGAVIQDGVVTAQLQVTAPAEFQSLTKEGANLFALNDAALQTRQQMHTTPVKSGHIEQSAVTPIDALMGMNRAASAVKRAAKMLQFHDETMEAAISKFGRVT
ncbi:MAG: flagellar hook-basal body protein [Planctomycetota bacterium]